MSERMARIVGTQDFALRTLFDLLEYVRVELLVDHDGGDFLPNWETRLVGQIDRSVTAAKTALRRAS